VLGDFSCPITGDLGSNPKHFAEMTVRAVINPAVGARPDYNLDIDVDVGNIDIDDIGIDILPRSVYCEENECQDCTIEIFGTCLDLPTGRCSECDTICGGLANFGALLVNNLTSIITPLLNGAINPVVDNVINSALAQINGTSAKVETPIDVAELSGLPLFRRSKALGLFVAPQPGQLSVNDRGFGPGMDLTFDAGIEAETADCVGPLPPFTASSGPVPNLSGVDSSGQPYHLGFTLSASYLNQALYTAHRAGTLCLKLSTEEVSALTGGAFTLNASLLSLIASDLGKVADPAAPVILEIKPRSPAGLELGTGERTGSDDMGNDVFDWLLKLGWSDVGVAFHVLIDDRYVRVFEVTTDIFAGFNLTVQPDNTLQAALGELRIEDFTEEFNELVPNADFALVLPTLLDVALGTILEQALVFDLDLTSAVSDALGGVPVFLRINDIFRDGEQQDFLSLSVTFSDTRQALTRGVQTQARLHPSEPGLVDRSSGEAARPTGQVRLLVDQGQSTGTEDQSTVGDDLEYQVRVDGGLWSVWRTARADGTLMATDARLHMPGWHQIEVRARETGRYLTVDTSPVVLRALVDPLAPRLSARLGREGIDVVVRDEESAGLPGLRLEMKPSNADDWLPIDLHMADDGRGNVQIDYASLRGAEEVRFRAQDGSGNPTATIALTVRIPGDAQQVNADADAESSGSCRNTEGGAGLGLWLVLGSALGLLRRRRRSV
ncbi:MAG: hypothetical protein AAFN74_08075, partial [Myxococcota bacterium]